MEIGFSRAVGLPWDASARITEALKRVTAAEVQRAAQTWFAEEGLTRVDVLPDGSAPRPVAVDPHAPRARLEVLQPVELPRLEAPRGHRCAHDDFDDRRGQALDAVDLSGYAGLKASLSARGVRLQDATPEDVAPFVQRGGIGHFLRELTTFLEERPHLRGRWLSDEARASLA